MTIEPAKIRDWMNSLADVMIQKPQLTQKELAAYFGYSEVWIGVVIRSDAFKEMMAARREVHAGLVSATVIEKVEALAHQTIEEMSRQISEKPQPLDKVREVADLALKSLGFGAPRGGVGVPGLAPQQTVNIVIDQAALASARQKMVERSSGVSEERMIDAKPNPAAGTSE